MDFPSRLTEGLAGAVAFADSQSASFRPDAYPDPSGVDRGVLIAGIPRVCASSLDRFSIPTIRAKYSVSLRKRVPSFDIVKFLALAHP